MQPVLQHQLKFGAIWQLRSVRARMLSLPFRFRATRIKKLVVVVGKFRLPNASWREWTLPEKRLRKEIGDKIEI